MTSYLLSFSDDKSVLNGYYYPPISLSPDSEIALLSFSTFYSYANVTHSNNNFYYDNNKHIVIPVGCYELEELNTYLSKKLKETDPENRDNLINLVGNRNTLKAELTCEYSVDFKRRGTINKLLGFEEKVLNRRTTYESKQVVKILQIETINIICDLVNNTYQNSDLTHILYSFTPSVPPGYAINEVPSTVVYLPLNTTEINQIQIRICDQNFNLIDNRKEQIYVKLHIKSK